MATLTVTYGRVTYRQAVIRADGNDLDTYPDIASPLTGVAKFKAKPKKLLFTGDGIISTTTYPKAAYAHFDAEGDLASYVKVGDNEIEQKGVFLVSANDPNMSPQEWGYVAEVTLYNEDGSLHSFEVFEFELGAGESVDLTEVTPLATTEGIPVVRGPRGYSVVIKGKVDNEAALPEFAEEGSIYVAADTNKLYSRLDGGEWLELPFLRGSDGTNGLSIVGPPGPEGPTGAAGKDGAGLDFSGEVFNVDALPTDAEDGDVYLTVEDGVLHYYDADTATWFHGHKIVGPEGPRGIQGIQGDKGDPGGFTSISMGTVTTAPAGAPADANFTGTPESKALNLILPRGNDGPANTLAVGTVTEGNDWNFSVRGAAPNQLIDVVAKKSGGSRGVFTKTLGSVSVDISNEDTNKNTMTTSVTVRRPMTLTALGFHALTPATYSLKINGVTVGSPVTVTNPPSTGTEVTTFGGLSSFMGVGTHSVSIVASGVVRARHTFSASLVYTTEETDFTVTGFTEINSTRTPAWVWTVQTDKSGKLGELDDVAVTAPTNGQALVWDSTAGTWKPGSAVQDTGTYKRAWNFGIPYEDFYAHVRRQSNLVTWQIRASLLAARENYEILNVASAQAAGFRPVYSPSTLGMSELKPTPTDITQKYAPMAITATTNAGGALLMSIWNTRPKAGATNSEYFQTNYYTTFSYITEDPFPAAVSLTGFTAGTTF